MKDGEGWRRKGLNGRVRRIEVERTKQRRDTTLRISWRRDVANSLKVRYRQNDVEPWLLPISIINTMKNNRGEETENPREPSGIVEKDCISYWPIFFLSIIGTEVASQYRLVCGCKRLRDARIPSFIYISSAIHEWFNFAGNPTMFLN